MSLTIITLPKVDAAPSKTPSMRADRRLYLASDEHTLVEHNDVRAAFLLAPVGGAIVGADVERLGLSLVDGRVIQAPPPDAESQESPADETDAGEDTGSTDDGSTAGDQGDGKKERTPPETKELVPDENKSRGKK